MVNTVSIAVLMLLAAAGPAAADGPATKIIEAAGVEGGLVVHVGCGDGRFTAALRADERYLVHGLDTDAADVAKARGHIRSLGLYGPVSVSTFGGTHLPYVDNLVNLIVAEDPGDVAVAEVMRVLVPGGVAMIGGRKTVKPWPAEIDEWTHYLYDATGNAVGHDVRVGPPRHVQWKAGPKFARHHDLAASTSAMVSSAGRVFTIADEGPPTLMNVPPKWRLVARDAFNGTLLWRREIPTWEPERPFRSGPPQIARRLVAVDGRVYVTLGIDAPVTELDAATGRTLRTFEGTEGADEIVLRDNVLLLIVGTQDPVTASTAQRRSALDRAARRSLIAVDLEKGTVPPAARDAVIWKRTGAETAGLRAATLAAGSRGVLFLRGTEVCCLDLRTGKPQWTRELPAGKASQPKGRGRGQYAASYFAPTLVVYEPAGVVLATQGPALHAFSLDDGKLLWECPCPPDFHAPSDVFVADGLVWAGLFAAEGRDPKTGKIKRKLDVDGLITPGHHPRCYRNKATDRFIIAGKRGMEFFSLRGEGHLRNDWARGQCQYGVMPCNGLLYLPPNPCCCYPNALLHGFYALAPSRKAESGKRKAETPRLQRGPAYRQVPSDKSEIRNLKSEIGTTPDWPSLRGGELRSGSTQAVLPIDLKPRWTASIGGKLSSPVIAGDRLLVTSIDACRVVALDANDGRELWSFITGSRVDTPPTIADGLAVFGCADGRIYCLRTADGSLVWRYRAAPMEKQIVVDNRLESVWPVHGSVLVKDGVAYAAAGRSVFLDGGITLCGLDLHTGRLRCEAHVAVDPKAAKSRAFIMDGVRPDVLVSDGKYIYLQHMQFDAALKPTGGRGRHILATSGLADDSWFYRTFWRLGLGDYENDFPPSYVKHRFVVPWGQLLVFDDRRVCGLKTHMSKGISPGTAVQSSAGCLLFGGPNTPFTPDAETLRTDFPLGKATATAAEPAWTAALTYQARAMLLARRGDGSQASPQDGLLFVAGWPSHDKQGVLEVYDPATGTRLATHTIASAPIFDGMAAAGGKLYISMKNGTLQCVGARR